MCFTILRPRPAVPPMLRENFQWQQQIGTTILPAGSVEWYAEIPPSPLGNIIPPGRANIEGPSGPPNPAA